MRGLRLLALTLLVLGASALRAQNAQTLKLRGRVVDATGAIMTATDVKVFSGTRVAKEGQTNNDGDFEFDLPQGEYRVEVSAPDFNTFRQTLQLSQNTQPLAVTLSLAVVETVVEVKDEANSIAVNLDTSLGTTTLAADQLADLPDNEDDLAAYLQSLAGARGGAEQSANFIIDGFNGGRLPPRDQIAQIIIENNPFSAEGGGDGPRIRIITRPGTGEWRGQMGFNFNDSAMNAQAANATNKPKKQTRTFNPQFSGPLIPGRVTMNFQGQSREQESEGNSIVAITPSGSVASGVVSPSTTRQMSPRFTIFLSQKHQMNVNLSFSKTRSTNQGIGGFNLPERASNRENRQFSFQISENATIGALNNELRFQMTRNTSSQTPTNSGVAINVIDAFNGGGAQNLSKTRGKSFQIADQIRTAFGLNGKYQVNAGVEFNYNDDYNFSQNNYIGTYTFSSLRDYCFAYYRRFGGFAGANCEPYGVPGLTDLGLATQFTQTSGDPLLQVNQMEFSAFFESVIRVAPKLAAQVGVRYQAQSHLRDYNNIGPRLALSYQLRPNTVIRAGAGIIYAQTGFSLNNYEQLLRNDGTTRQFQTVISNAVFGDPFAGAVASTTGVASTIRTRSADFVSPYTIRGQLGVDQKITNQMGVNVTYEYGRGNHLLRTRNINAPLPACVALLGLNPTTTQLSTCRPDPTKGNINQYESTAKSLSHNLSTQLRQNFRIHNNVNVQFQASYTLGWSWDDGGSGGGGNFNGGGNQGGNNRNGGGGGGNFQGGGDQGGGNFQGGGGGGSLPSNNYDLAGDWGRSNNDQRHRVQGGMMISFPAVWRGPLTFTMQQINWNSGRPYNITTGKDDNGDTSINDRPLGLVRNAGDGPMNYNVNLRISKTFFLKPAPAQPGNAANNFGEPQRGNDGGFGNFGGGNQGGTQGGNQGGNQGGFGGDFGNFGGNRGNNRNNNRNNQNFGNGPRMTFNLNLNNVLNHPQESIQSGVLTSPFFGRITGSNPRTISLNLQFQF